MNKTFSRTLVAAVLALSLTLSACGGAPSTAPTPETSAARESITQELISILDNNPDVKSMLQKSIDKAKEINPDKNTNPAQTLEEYYGYVDWAAKAMPWNISKKVDSDSLYTRIDQSLNYFYFINDIPLEELDGKGLYNNSLQYAEPYRSWLIKFTKEWGEYLSTDRSWNNEYYDLLYNDEQFGLKADLYESPSNWKSFNDFFARRLSSPSKRPIAQETDSSVVVSPADSEPQGVWSIGNDSMIVQKQDELVIKSREFNSIADLIGPDSKYKNEFAGGTMTHIFLDVHNYHRYHFPVGGVIKEVTMIPQDDAVGGWVSWDKDSGLYVLNAGLPGWQMIETRACVIVDTEQYGLAALLPIGMSQVSSVNFEDSVKVGQRVKKGDELGYFLFGGSDFVMIFQKGAGFEMSAPLDKSGSNYKPIEMGQEYGKLTGAKT